MDSISGDGLNRRWSSSFKDDNGARDQLVVCERHVEAVRPHFCRFIQRFAVQMQFRFSRGQSFDFNVLPLYASRPARPERLECSFLRCKPGCIVDRRICALAAVGDFLFGVDAVYKPIPEFLNRVADPVVLNNVDANACNHLPKYRKTTKGTKFTRSTNRF